MERATPVRTSHTSTADLLTWSEVGPATATSSASAYRSRQPSDGISNVLFGGQVSDQESESLNKRFNHLRRIPKMAQTIGGQRTERPPYFDGSNYAYWKKMISWYVMEDLNVYKTIMYGVTLPPMEKMGEWTREEKGIVEINAKAMNILFCALGLEEFNRVSTCKTAKEIWDKLEITHEDTSQVRETKLNLLIHEYELFSMKSWESIKDMFTRFNDIVTCLEALGKTYSNGEKVRKILRSLPKEWDLKVMVIQEVKDLDILSVDDLIGSLMSHEIMMKRDDNEEKRDKSLLFKVSHSSSEDDDIVILTRKFKRFIREEKLKEELEERRNLRAKKDKFEGEKHRREVKCFGCQKFGHIKSECPSFKKSKKKFKKKALATWSDEDQSTSSNESSDGNLCLVAQHEDMRRPSSGYKLKEMTGSKIFAGEDGEQNSGSANSNHANKTGVRTYQQAINGISQISFSTEGKVSAKKPTTLPEVAKQRELGGTLKSETTAKIGKQFSDAKCKELSGNNIFGPPSETPPRSLAAARRSSGRKESKDMIEPAPRDVRTSVRVSNPAGGQSNIVFGNEPPVVRTTKKIHNQKFAELTGNEIFKGDVPPGSAEKPLSMAKLREISGNNIFADGKAESRDYHRGIRQPPGGDSSIALV